MTTTNTTAEIDLATWCRDRAAAHRNYERHELPMYEDRDVALIEWTVRVLGNPLTVTSAEVLRIIAAQHGLELNPDGTNAALTQSREQAATYANEIGALKAELERMRATDLRTERDWLLARADDNTRADHHRIHNAQNAQVTR